MELEFLLQVRPLMSHHLTSLDTLYSRFDAIARRGAPGDSTAAHEAVQDRLAANRAVADRNGWTSLALERAGGTGRLRLWGVPPSREDREVVPDWSPIEQ
jgi:hypothetical protein